MDTTTTVEEVGRWPVDQQLEFAFRVWDQILDAGWTPAPTPELLAELERRLAAHDAAPEQVHTWEEVVAHVRRERWCPPPPSYPRRWTTSTPPTPITKHGCRVWANGS